MGITVKEIGVFTCSGCKDTREVNPYDLEGVWRVAVEQHFSADAILEGSSWFILCDACAGKVLLALGEPKAP